MERKLVEMQVAVGNDNGNSEHDIIINGFSIEQPNVMAKVRKLPMLDEVNPEYVAKNIDDNLIVTITSPSSAPGIYFIGKYALGSGEKIRNIEVGVDNSKVDTDVVINNTLARIAGYCVRQAFLNQEDLNKIEISVKVDMTTALPVTQYSKATAKYFTDKFMSDKGKHIVIVHVGNINVNVNIVFEFVKVLPESVSATFALQNMTFINKPADILSDEEKAHNAMVQEVFSELSEKLQTDIDGKYFKNKRILHVGIGEGTTEYPLTNDIVFDPNFIKGSNNGIGHSIDKALGEFMEQQNLLTYSRQKFSEVLRTVSHKYYDAAMDIVDGYIEEESMDIIKHVKTEIQRANNEVDIVAVYGGGSILMREFLEDKIESVCEKANIVLYYVPAKYAVTLESKGMFEFTKSKIFKLLKEKNNRRS